MLRACWLLLFVLQMRAAVSPDLAPRREELRKSIPYGVLVLFGNRESDDLHYGFFQEVNFLYLTGWEEPGAILVMTPKPDKEEPGAVERERVPREILFLPQRSPSGEKWTGRKLGPDDSNVKDATGFASVMPAEQFESELGKLLAIYPTLYALKDDPQAATLGRMAPLRTVNDAKASIGRLRMVKTASEVAAIQRATDASIDAHRAAWRAIGPGKYEYQIAAVMTGTYMAEGCRRGAYAPTVGSGPNSTTLHYSRNGRRMDAGEVVVMDVAGECGNYASDITRTVPANGKFTARQREIYEIVLGAQKAAIAAAKPGMTIGRGRKSPSLYQIAYDYIDTHGKDLHGQPLGKYFIHGLSHGVGLDVHDPTDTAGPLSAGMVITVEPGIYIPEENLGVRIEDVILITESGAKLMSGALPKEPGEIESALGERK